MDKVNTQYTTADIFDLLAQVETEALELNELMTSGEYPDMSKDRMNDLGEKLTAATGALVLASEWLAQNHRA